MKIILLLLSIYFIAYGSESIQTNEQLNTQADSMNKHQSAEEFANLGLRVDTTVKEVSGKMQPGSHVKLFLPNLPYLAISHAINGTLIRPYDNEKGYRYYLAISHKSIDNKIWEFKLRRDVKFQDGTPFNVDSVILNMKYFKKKPYLFSAMHELFDYAQKVDDYTVRFHFKKPYGMFLQDAICIQYYTKTYLEKFGWNGKPTSPNLAEAGLYGLGPYILTQGYIEGDRRTKKVVLKANKNYWGKDKPKVETITVYTDLKFNEAAHMVQDSEGELDITSLQFQQSIQTVLSKYAKLTTSPSTNNYSMHFNMINGNKALLDVRIRYVINKSINQEYLLNLSMLGQGELSPTMVSPNFYRIDEAINSLEGYFKNQKKDTTQELIEMVREYQKENGLDSTKALKISILAQKSFLFLIKDIKYFLSKVHIDLEINLVPTEAEVFKNLLTTYKSENPKSWDLLLWGNYDWFKHPWAAFFVYKPFYSWSSIPKNVKLQEYTEKMMSINTESKEYVPFMAEFIKYVYDNNFMVYLPTPHSLYAVNKEVLFHASTSAFISLRDIEVTPYHWSIRKEKEYPISRQVPIIVDNQGLKK